jgi:hypothetical protein
MMLNMHFKRLSDWLRDLDSTETKFMFWKENIGYDKVR